MNFKDLKQWQQLDAEISFWEGVVGGEDHNNGWGILCSEYDNALSYTEVGGVEYVCQGCPLKEYIGTDCSKGTPFHEWENDKTPQTAQAMVDRLKEIRYRLFRLDR